MRMWRGMVLLCGLALGCGGAPPEDGLHEDDRSQGSSLTERGDGEPNTIGGGTEPGLARLVKDIFPPVSGRPPWLAPSPESLVAFRGRLYFAANFEDGRRQLWKSDGTRAGTVPVKAFPALASPSFTDALGSLTPLGSRLFFVVKDETHGRELWVSDGSSAGTRRVKDLTPGPGDSELYNLQVVGGRLLFFRFIPETPTSPARQELWKSDGTEAGTRLVKDLGPDTSLSFSQAIVEDTLFFVFTDPAHGTELWKSDGTAAGTRLVKDIVPGPEGSGPFNLKALGRHVFFTAADPAHGHTLWRTDGTSASTRRVLELVPGPEGDAIQVLDAMGSYLYFARTDPSDAYSTRLYRLRDGVDSVHVRHVATLPNPYGDPDSYTYITTSAVAGRKLFMALAIYGSGPAPRDVQLWVTDGTGSGTKMLHRPLSRSDEFGSTLYALDNRILFSGAEEATGLELWMSDGTVSGTRLLRDIAPGGASSFPEGFTRVGSKVFFVANDVAHGNELWVLPLLPYWHLGADEADDS